MPKRHAWTGISNAVTAGSEDIHAEIAASQVTRWTPAQIKAAQKAGYFDSLTRRAMKNTRLGLLAELAGDDAEC
jgi:hypothetical protein